jgi:predicted RNA polymerase sigma factor
MAKHKAIDRIRRERAQQSKYTQIAVDPSAQQPSAMPAPDAVEGVEDDLLALVFVACHPVLPRESRVALTLRLVGGLRTDEIARAFLVAPSPVVELNRAVALLHSDGPEAALAALDAVRDDPRLARLHLYDAAATAPTRRERNLLMARAASASARTEP